MARKGMTVTMSNATNRLKRLRGSFSDMCRIRAFEETVADAAAAGKLPGLLHLSHGAEAVAVGVMSNLQDGDCCYTSHRPHGHFLAAGVDPQAIMSELAGRETGLCRGRGGTMHLSSATVILATGVVGGPLPLAVGHALRQPPGNVVIVFFGDGAVQTGLFHESLNLAALWRVPVLFVCENNGWAEFSSREEHTTVGNVVRYGDLYGIPAQEVDGADIEAVSDAVETLLAGIRAGDGPALLECHIARLRSHYEGDWREQSSEGDPISQLGQSLVELGASLDELEAERVTHSAWATALLDSALNELPADPAHDHELVYRSTL